MVKNRHIELDFLRGVAIIGMIVYHFFYIGDFYDVFSLNFNEWYWASLATFVRVVFLGLVGVSLSLSANRFKKMFLIFACAMAITLVTFLFVPNDFVIFGILHQIAFSILFLRFVSKKPFIALFIGFIVLIIGLLINGVKVDHSVVLNIIGFQSKGFSSLDYFPIFPWMSIPAFGIFLGNLFYKNKVVKNDSDSLFVNVIALCGRHSLFIYMGHLLLLILAFRFISI